MSRIAPADPGADPRPTPGGRATAARPALLVLNQTVGPLARELTEELAAEFGPVALLAGVAEGPVAAGVTLHRAARYRRGGYAARIASWSRYTLQATRWLRRMPPAPVILFSNPPMLPWVGGLICRMRGQPYAVVVLDIHPDASVRLGAISARNPLVPLWRRLNRRAYEGARLVVTLGDRMAGRLARQFDAARTGAGRVMVMSPWADTRQLRPIPKESNAFAREHGQLDHITVLYSGNMGLGHDLETLLRVAERLRDVERLRFLCVGEGVRRAEVERTIRERGLANVTLLPWQSAEVFPLSLAVGEIAVVTLEPGMEGLALPSKAFSSLAVGSAILAVCAEGSELADLVADRECGWVVRPGDVDRMTAVLRAVAEGEVDLPALRRRSRQAAETIGSRENGRVAARLFRASFAETGAAPAEAG